MITTIDIKARLRDVFEIGSGDKNILILGSCRTVAYLNYLDRWNRSWMPAPFRIFAIEPNNYHWDEHGHTANIQEELTKLETSERILSILKSTAIFIHEHYANFQMFNTSRDSEKNIYQFGMNAPIDISIPNFHDRFVLFNDYADCGVVAPDNYIGRGEEAISGFCEVCKLSSFPEMADYFRDNWRTTRFFWRPNHTSAAFTLYIFRLMNEKFLNLQLTNEFWAGAEQEDLFRNPNTQVTQRDIEGYKLLW